MGLNLPGRIHPRRMFRAAYSIPSQRKKIVETLASVDPTLPGFSVFGEPRRCLVLSVPGVSGLVRSLENQTTRETPRPAARVPSTGDFLSISLSVRPPTRFSPIRKKDAGYGAGGRFATAHIPLRAKEQGLMGRAAVYHESVRATFLSGGVSDRESMSDLLGKGRCHWFGTAGADGFGESLGDRLAGFLAVSQHPALDLEQVMDQVLAIILV